LINLDLSDKVGRLLRDRGKSLCVAESCTGGLLGSIITAVPGASDYFQGGIICYSNRIKRDLLGVSSELLEEHGAVSSEVVNSMAEQACRLFGAECGIAISGIAGPAGEGRGKPVGLVYIGIRCGERSEIVENNFSGTRNQIREQSCLKAIEAMIDMLRLTSW
jgi:PncC family amidohydrolase